MALVRTASVADAEESIKPVIIRDAEVASVENCSETVAEEVEYDTFSVELSDENEEVGKTAEETSFGELSEEVVAVGEALRP